MSDSAVLLEPPTRSETIPVDGPREIPATPTTDTSAITGASTGATSATTSASTALDESRSAIERATALPPALRERLLTLVSACPPNEPVSLAQVLVAVEESLPEYLRAQPIPPQPTHPAGEAFFSGAAGELTDSEAETLAQQQLQRAGLLRGQKVRVAN